MQPLSRNQQQAILHGLVSYTDALKGGCGASRETAHNQTPIIRTGYVPGLIGTIARMHATFYNKLVGFDLTFETLLATDLCEFMPRLNRNQNSVWYVWNQENIVGSIAIDGQDLDQNHAHLRWFIVDTSLHGTGIGSALLKRAVEFCDDRKFTEIHLWTFRGLDAARHLYERHNFQLIEERAGSQWGDDVVEQLFVRRKLS